MRKFKVKVVERSIATQWVTVEASNKAEAKSIAIDTCDPEKFANKVDSSEYYVDDEYVIALKEVN